MGGISFTSSYFYNAGKTKDLRDVLNYLVGSYPMAPIFLVGTSIGANIVICSRFLGQTLVQRVYDRALAIGIKSYAQLNKANYVKYADWEGILKVGEDSQ